MPLTAVDHTPLTAGDRLVQALCFERMPCMHRLSLELALLRTYAIPSVSGLLARTRVSAGGRWWVRGGAAGRAGGMVAEAAESCAAPRLQGCALTNVLFLSRLICSDGGITAPVSTPTSAHPPLPLPSPAPIPHRSLRLIL